MSAFGPNGRDLPLMAWGEELRRRKIARRRLVLRSASVAIFSLTAMSPILLAPAPRLVWNASASAPVGLYWVGIGHRFRRGDLVVARLPAGAARLAADRKYLPAGLPVVKYIGGLGADRICGTPKGVTINGEGVVRRLAADHEGRPLAAWLGCMTLGEDQVLLLNRHAPDSFDGRYFGPAKRHDILGLAHPLWLR